MREDFERRLLAFIGENFLDGDAQGELDATTPLLEWGVLDSLKIAVLLSFIRNDLGVTVPFQYISARNFGTVRAIAELSAELVEPGDGQDAYAGSAKSTPTA